MLQFLSERGDHNDRLRRRHFFDADSQFVPLHARHIEIRDHQIKTVVSKQIKSFPPIFSLSDYVLVHMKQQFYRLTDAELVFRKQNAPSMDCIRPHTCLRKHFKYQAEGEGIIPENDVWRLDTPTFLSLFFIC